MKWFRISVQQEKLLNGTKHSNNISTCGVSKSAILVHSYFTSYIYPNTICRIDLE